jgi:hypothetical protein
MEKKGALKWQVMQVEEMQTAAAVVVVEDLRWVDLGEVRTIFE